MSQRDDLRIAERFTSIQGEGLLVGTPSSFIRISGCNLRCDWCDTPDSSWRPQGERMSLDELVRFCGAGPRHVVITGGEPLLFPAVARLTRLLADAGHHITIETAGTSWLDELSCDLMSLSPKLAHSSPRRLSGSWSRIHDERRHRPEIVRRLLAFPWQLKFVVRTASQRQLDCDLREIDQQLELIPIADSDRERVLLMPQCIDADTLVEAYRMLVPICQARGFRIGQRLHIALFGHTPGT